MVVMNKKILFLNINTKFTHSSLAVPYLLAYLKKKVPELKTCFIERELQSSPETIAYDIINFSPDILAISVYLWNVDFYREIIEIVRNCQKKITIVAGGPEVSFDSKRYSDIFDYMICGEGEIPFYDFITSGCQNSSVFDSSIKNDTLPYELSDLSLLPSPFLNNTYNLENRAFIFYESSRGCSWNCSYCSSSNSRNVRNFPLERVYAELDFLIKSDVKSIRFIDRTFNADNQRCCNIIEYILKNNQNKRFQFEIRPELITDDLIDILKRSQPDEIQFEIGIQSMNIDVLRRINRGADLEKVEKNLMSLSQKTPVHLHLDLINGLPGETKQSFFSAVDKVYSMGADTIQIGRLKVLSGTKIRTCEDLFFSKKAPYQIIATQEMDFNDIYEIDRISRIAQIYFNDGKFKNSISFLASLFGSFSDFFTSLTKFWISRKLPWSKMGLKKLTGYLLDFIMTLDIKTKEILVAKELLQVDFHLLCRDKFEFKSNENTTSDKIVYSDVKNVKIGIDSMIKLNGRVRYLNLSHETVKYLGRKNSHCFILTSKRKNEKSHVIEFDDELELNIMVNLVNKVLTARKKSEILNVDVEKVLNCICKLYDKKLILV